eukprot:jgi/Tetstr1/454121/TSEL_041040.t1
MSLLFVGMTTQFVLVVVLGLIVLPSEVRIFGVRLAPTVTKPRHLIPVKMAMDAWVTLMMIAFWWWDPVHRHEFLNKSPLLANALSWVRFDTPCLREGIPCGAASTVKFFWHVLFWSSLVSSVWWPFLDPCVSMTRASVDRCVKRTACDTTSAAAAATSPAACDDGGMCQECEGYSDMRVMWTVVGLDCLTITVSMCVLLLARFTVFRGKPFVTLGQVLARGVSFMGIVFLVRLAIEMGNMLFEAETSLASRYLPPDVASAVNECSVAQSARAIVASCVQSAAASRASAVAGADGGKEAAASMPKTLGKLVVLQSMMTTRIVTGLVLSGLLMQWIVRKLRREGDREDDDGEQSDNEQNDAEEQELEEEQEREDNEGRVSELMAAPSLKTMPPEEAQKVQEAAQKTIDLTKEADGITREMHDLETKIQESTDEAETQILKQQMTELRAKKDAVVGEIKKNKADVQATISKQAVDLSAQRSEIEAEMARAKGDAASAEQAATEAAEAVDRDIEAKRTAAVDQAQQVANDADAELAKQRLELQKVDTEMQNATEISEKKQTELGEIQNQIKELENSNAPMPPEVRQRKMEELQSAEKDLQGDIARHSAELTRLQEGKQTVTAGIAQAEEASKTAKENVESTKKASFEADPEMVKRREDARAARAEASASVDKASEKASEHEKKRAEFEKVQTNSLLSDAQQSAKGKHDNLKKDMDANTKKINDTRSAMNDVTDAKVKAAMQAQIEAMQEKQTDLERQTATADAELKIADKIEEKRKEGTFTEAQLEAEFKEKKAELKRSEAESEIESTKKKIDELSKGDQANDPKIQDKLSKELAKMDSLTDSKAAAETGIKEAQKQKKAADLGAKKAAARLKRENKRKTKKMNKKLKKMNKKPGKLSQMFKRKKP